MIHTASHRRDDGSSFSRENLLQHPDSLLHDETAVDIRAVKDQVPGRKEQHVLIKTAVIVVDLPGPQLTVGHNDPEQKILAESIDKMSLLGIDAALHLCHALLFFQAIPYGLKFPQRFQGFCKSFHLSTFLL